MGKRIRHQILQSSVFLLLLFGMLTIYVIYLMGVSADRLMANPMNRRNSIVSPQVERGSILDEKGRLLAGNREDGSRTYPYSEAAAHVVGYFGDACGFAGIEGFANQELMGVSNELHRLGPAGQLFETDKGNDVTLTLNAEAQQAAWDGLNGRRGAVVVLDAETGAVLALVSAPSFDPERVAYDWEDLLQQEESPLLNRALSGLYPPGSTIKPMILDIALEQKRTDPGDIFQCTGLLDVGGGYTIQESHGEVHGPVTLSEALRRSCNITFGTLGMRLGGQALRNGFHRFGFDQPLHGELDETENHLPDFPSLDSGDLAQVGIGQSTLLVTPLHMALLAAAMEHGGVVMKPYLISEIRSSKDTLLYQAVPKTWLTVTSPENAALIRGWMEGVVERGTGTAAAISGVRIAGKTGTAENPKGDDHAWFIGSADIGERKIAFAVLVEHGGEGGKAAAPIARDIIMSLIQ